jgi:hypothetical protein
VISGHIPNDADELRPGYEMLIKLLPLFDDTDSTDTTESDTSSALQADATHMTETDTNTTTSTEQDMLLEEVESKLADIQRVFNITYTKYIENHRAVKLLLQPLGQALARGVPNLQLSIELQDMIASLDSADDAAVQVDEADDTVIEDNDAESNDTNKMFDSWVTSIINFCKQYVLEQ